ncbi:GNAT family N-acetyltransferase [Candidatus Roizmanbacteria bacterium]|nr:GNAT family N-acetyltransferase [Candidatus Roizmanbacteria bacterium]
MRIVVKKAGKDYLKSAVKLEKFLIFPLVTSATKKDLEPIFDNSLMWGVFDGDNLVGKVGYLKNEKDEYEVDGVVVHPDYRGKGLGKKLLSKAIKDLLKIHPKKIILYVHPQNSRAIVLYLKFGFIIQRWISNKYGDGEPRLKMSLDLKKT